ncbi:MAG TPA: hypothetical protein VLA02_02665 [Reyranella sp.]|nr:hypothetical protein [Reyranella sp.]
MTVPKSTFGLLGLAVATLAAGYLFMPVPGARALPQPAPRAVTPSVPAPADASAPAPAAKLAPAMAANRPPVPLVTRGHANYFPSPTIDGTGAGKSVNGKPAVDTLSPEAQQATGVQQANGTQEALLADPKTGDDSKAKAAIELDGYKNVRGLVQDAGGVWRGRAMRGRTEIAIRMNADGSVSAD